MQSRIFYWRKWYDPDKHVLYEEPFIDTSIPLPSTHRVSELDSAAVKRPQQQFVIESADQVKWVDYGKRNQAIMVPRRCRVDGRQEDAFIKVGDCVYLDNGEDHFWIAKVVGFTEEQEDESVVEFASGGGKGKETITGDVSGSTSGSGSATGGVQRMINLKCQWYWSAADTVLEDKLQQSIRRQEVFASHEVDVNPITVVVGKCWVEYMDHVSDWSALCDNPNRYFYRYQYNKWSYAFFDPHITGNRDEDDSVRFAETDEVAMTRAHVGKIGWILPSFEAPEVHRMPVWEKAEMRGSRRARYYSGFTLDGREFKLGDCVCVNDYSPARPLCWKVCLVLCVWEDLETGSKFMRGQWFWSPSDPDTVVSVVHYKQPEGVKKFEAEEVEKAMEQWKKEDHRNEFDPDDDSEDEDYEDKGSKLNRRGNGSVTYNAMKPYRHHPNELFMSRRTDVIDIHDVVKKINVNFFTKADLEDEDDGDNGDEDENEDEDEDGEGRRARVVGWQSSYEVGEYLAVVPTLNTPFWLCCVLRPAEPTSEMVSIKWLRSTGKALLV